MIITILLLFLRLLLLLLLSLSLLLLLVTIFFGFIGVEYQLRHCPVFFSSCLCYFSFLLFFLFLIYIVQETNLIKLKFKYKLCWDETYTVGLPKQRNSCQSNPTFLCLETIPYHVTISCKGPISVVMAEEVKSKTFRRVPIKILKMPRISKRCLLLPLMYIGCHQSFGLRRAPRHHAVVLKLVKYFFKDCMTGLEGLPCHLYCQHSYKTPNPYSQQVLLHIFIFTQVVVLQHLIFTFTSPFVIKLY